MGLDDLLGTLRRWSRPWETGSEPLEVRRALLEEVERQVVAVGGGRRVFPFQRLEVYLLAPSEERARWEAILQEGWDLRKEIQEHLESLGARVPPGLSVAVQVVEQGGPEFGERRFRVIYHRGDSAAAAPEKLSSPRPALDLTVLHGKAGQQVYTLTAERVCLGRLAEVVDAEGRVSRRNDVAFLDTEGTNQTVSRAHARIAWDEEAQAFRLRDEQSAAGTRILREGRQIEVSGHDRRGVRLHSGDEIYLGRACVKVRLRAASPEE